MATKRLKRPRDPLALAKLIGDIATGQVQDRSHPSRDEQKNEAAVLLGRKGGVARARKMTAKERAKAAKKAALMRWAARSR